MVRAFYEAEGRKPELPLGESAQQVLDFANQEAKKFHRQWVVTEDLLAGLARQNDTSLVLQQVGVNYFKVSNALYSIFDYGYLLDPEEPAIELDTMSVINKAIEKAKTEGKKEVTSLDLLETFLTKGSGGMDVLNSFGVSSQDVLSALALIKLLKTDEGLKTTYDNLKSVFNNPKIDEQIKAKFAEHVIDLAKKYLEQPPTPSLTV